MRLTEEERRAIVEEIRAKVPRADIYLYGSRADDRLKGGDIDVLAIGPDFEWMDKIDILIAIKSRIGEQRIDLKLLTPEEAAEDAFVQSILPTAVSLWSHLSKTPTEHHGRT
jgi:uncharacterized protein